MGGHGAWMFASQQPHLFAAVVVVCGYTQGSNEARRVAERLAHAGTAVAVYHSADDSVIPVQASDQVVAQLRAKGYSTDGPTSLRLRVVRYDHAPGPPMPEYAFLIGHGSYELAFRDDGLYSWLLAQACNTCKAGGQLSSPSAWSPLQTSRASAGELRR